MHNMYIHMCIILTSHHLKATLKFSKIQIMAFKVRFWLTLITLLEDKLLMDHD